MTNESTELNAAIQNQTPLVVFNDETKVAFVDVWRDRLRDAIEYHHSEVLKQRAERILRFVEVRPSARLQFFILKIRGENRAVMFDPETNETLVMTEESANQSS